MGNITDKCCNPENDANHQPKQILSLAEVNKAALNKSASNFSDQAFQNIFSQNPDIKQPVNNEPTKSGQCAAATSALRKKSTLHGEIIGARPKLNSITIGFSMHAHNFPISGINATTQSHKKNSMRKRSKLHSMKPPHFEILSEK